MSRRSISGEPEHDAGSANASAEIEGSVSICPHERCERNSQQYNPKKPKWWSRRCGNPTKAQKRATIEIFQTHRLPTVEFGGLLDWSSMFAPDTSIWLEIGFGKGENLLALAHRNKDENIAFIGSEIHRSAMGTICRRIQKSLESGVFWSDYVLYNCSMTGPPASSMDDADKSRDNCSVSELDTEDDKQTTSVKVEESDRLQPYQNLRLYPGDAIKLFPYIPLSSLATVLVTFPDPFPEDNDKEWRLIQVETLQEIHRVLRKSPSEGLFFLATDHEGYNRWSHDVMDDVNRESVLFEKVEPCPDRLEWLPAVSRYEMKGWEERRRSMLSCWTAKKS